MSVPEPILDRQAEALELFGRRVHAIHDDQWEAPTPCSDWSVRDLVGHLVSEQAWVPALVRDGATVDAVGDSLDGDLLGADPVAAWEAVAEASRSVFAEPGALDRTVHLSFGDMPAGDYCAQLVTDLTVHAWDLSRAIGADEELPGDLLSFAVREVTPHAAELEKSGLFAAPEEPPPGADVQTKLLCLVGRRP
ncbi:TIGR03086 family metal-binding protein [Streptomyces aureus]|uniref:TIGR03086 family metal-binding protein n=1 Tax=Streptomyces aureus TaxID=193461 RepID=UPI0005631E17|nr:TIGR03086 family metal-binding protein [Streptomyces aureus]